MNNENGLPKEIQKFLDTYLHTEAERAEFLKTYAALDSEIERAAFREIAAEPFDEAEVAAAIQFHETLKRNHAN